MGGRDRHPAARARRRSSEFAERRLRASPSRASRTTTSCNNGWLEEGQLLRDAGRLRGIPGVIVQGRYDCLHPAGRGWELKQAWPEVELNIMPDAGHLFNEPGNLDGLIRATDQFADR